MVGPSLTPNQSDHGAYSETIYLIVIVFLAKCRLELVCAPSIFITSTYYSPFV